LDKERQSNPLPCLQTKPPTVHKS